MIYVLEGAIDSYWRNARRFGEVHTYVCAKIAYLRGRISQYSCPLIAYLASQL